MVPGSIPGAGASSPATPGPRRVAQRQSAPLTRERSVVRSHSRRLGTFSPPKCPRVQECPCPRVPMPAPSRGAGEFPARAPSNRVGVSPARPRGLAPPHKGAHPAVLVRALAGCQGAVAQSVARLDGIEKVAGSRPAGSTPGRPPAPTRFASSTTKRPGLRDGVRGAPRCAVRRSTSCGCRPRRASCSSPRRCGRPWTTG